MECPGPPWGGILQVYSDRLSQASRGPAQSRRRLANLARRTQPATAPCGTVRAAWRRRDYSGQTASLPRRLASPKRAFGDAR